MANKKGFDLGPPPPPWCLSVIITVCEGAIYRDITECSSYWNDHYKLPCLIGLRRLIISLKSSTMIRAYFLSMSIEEEVSSVPLCKSGNTDTSIFGTDETSHKCKTCACRTS